MGISRFEVASPAITGWVVCFKLMRSRNIVYGFGARQNITGHTRQNLPLQDDK